MNGDENLKKRILLVEDDIALSEMYQKKFEVEGFATHVALEGETGLELALQEKPDIVLLDLLMPKMDGMAVMKKLREDIWGKTVPIIILTNLNASDKIVHTISQDHNSYYLMKANSTPQDVVEKVKQVLR